MRFQLALTALLAAVPTVFGQANQTQVNQTYVAGVLKALQGAGLTSLADALQGAANTTAGIQLLSSLSANNTNFTVFAPNNDAFKTAQSSLSNDSAIGDIIAYHIARGTYNTTDFALSPNHTIIPTLLNDTSIVQLGGNQSAVLVATAKNNTSSNTTTVTIINNDKNATVTQSTVYQNLIIHVINSVLTPPPSLTDAANSLGLSSLVSALKTADLDGNVTNSKGLTIFAPTNAALTKALSALGSQATNVTFIQAILGNHIINGTEVYSTQFGSGKYTSASGQPFSFNVTGNGTTVTSGNATANIVQSDIPVQNGVVHLIDAVLANGNTDPGAASSAYASATSAAASTPTPSGPIGSSPSGNGAQALTKGSFGAIAGATVVTVGAALLGSVLVF